MPPAKRPHYERPYNNEPITDATRAALADLVTAHGVRGVLKGLSEVYGEKAKSSELPPGNRSALVRTSRVLESALDALPLQVR